MGRFRASRYKYLTSEPTFRMRSRKSARRLSIRMPMEYRLPFPLEGYQKRATHRFQGLGRERTKVEWDQLFNRSGLVLKETVRLASLGQMLVLMPASGERAGPRPDTNEAAVEKSGITGLWRCRVRELKSHISAHRQPPSRRAGWPHSSWSATIRYADISK